VALNRTSAALTLAGITLTTPNIGTPSAGVLTSCTGLPYSGLANGTDGNLITWDAAGVIAVVATGDATQVLTSNGVGTAPTFQAAAGGGGAVDWIVKNNTYTSENGDGILADTSGNTWTLTLPVIPDVGYVVGISDSTSSFSTNNLTIARNGSKIMGELENLVVDINDASFLLVYTGDSTGWKLDTFFPVGSQLVKATGAEIDTGTDDAKFATPKAIEDSGLAKTSEIPVKATAAELDTGEDDAKFATALAIKDSHNVPSVVPSTAGKVLTSDGTDWISAAIGAADLPAALTPTTIDLGHASDTTLSRSAAGVLAVEGVVVPTISSVSTFTNKRVTIRYDGTTSHATPTINTDNVDMYGLTAQAEAITSMTTNLSGTPTQGQKLWIQITGTAARAISWGASFEASTVALPTTTVTTARLDVGFVWNTVTSKWRCIAVA